MKKNNFNSEKSSDKNVKNENFTEKDYDRVFSKIMSDPRLIAHLEKIKSSNR